jgi:hypothetical protein
VSHCCPKQIAANVEAARGRLQAHLALHAVIGGVQCHGIGESIRRDRLLTLIFRSRHFLHPVEGRPRYTMLKVVESYCFSKTSWEFQSRTFPVHEIDARSNPMREWFFAITTLDRERERGSKIAVCNYLSKTMRSRGTSTVSKGCPQVV